MSSNPTESNQEVASAADSASGTSENSAPKPSPAPMTPMKPSQPASGNDKKQDHMMDLVDNLGQMVSDINKGVTDFVMENTGMNKVIKTATDGVDKVINTAKEGIKSGLSSIGDSIKSNFSKMTDSSSPSPTENISGSDEVNNYKPNMPSTESSTGPDDTDLASKIDAAP